MGRVVVSVRGPDAGTRVDLEVPSDLPAEDLIGRVVDSLGQPRGDGPLELRSSALGRALEPQETLADADLCDGTALALARAGDPLDVSPTVLALAVVPDSTRLPVPPVWSLAATEPPRRPTALLIGGAVLLLLVLASAGVWFARFRESPTVSATTAAAPPAPAQPAATADLPTSVPNIEPTGRPIAAIATDESAWRDLQPSLDAVWGNDWPSAISLLHGFHTQYPTRTAATDKLYAAMIEYGRALHDASANAAAVDVFDQAVRLAPQRFEARAELAALTPVSVPAEPQAAPPPIAQPAPILRANPAPAPVAVQPTPAGPAPPAPPAPVAVEPVPVDPNACDVQSLEVACPLADGVHVVDSVTQPNGRHYYWFGVPTPGMRLHVELTSAGAPFALLLFSDESADPTAPIGGANGSDSGTTVFDQVMPNMGAYVLEVVPEQDVEAGAHLGYSLAFGLQPLPTPTVVVVVADAPPPVPSPTPVSFVAVPPVAARSASTAADRLRQVGLLARMQSGDRFSGGGPGTVALQEPPAGSSVPAGSTITLTIATGNVVVPAAVGLLEQDASNALRDASVQVETRHIRRSGVEAGRVADLSPPSGSVVPSGSLVVVTISQGE